MRRLLRLLLLPCWAAVAVNPAPAHDSLYHYAEVTRLPGSGGVELAFSIHLGDLAAARALGAAETTSSLACLKDRRPAEVGTVLAEAAALLAAILEFDPAGSGSWTLPEAAALSRDPSAFEGARPGFLVATCRLPAGDPAPGLRYRREAGKRLLLVIPRAGQFPLVRDLAPGSSESLAGLAPPLPSP